MPTHAYPIPRLPVLGPDTFSGAAEGDTPCLLQLPGASFTTSGRASILLGLEALGLAPGDQVLLPSYHCPTMVAPVVHLRAEPLFYPLDGTGAPSLAWLQAQDLRRVRVLLVAHFFGLPQPMQTVRQWCDAQRIALLEDCAHALFGRSGERALGAWGDVAIGSLTKFFPLTSGGCLILDPQKHAAPDLRRAAPAAGARVMLDAVELSAQHGRLPGLSGLVTGTLAALRSLRGGKAATQSERPDSQILPDLASMGALDTELAHQQLPATGRWMARHIPRDRIVRQRRLRYQQLTDRLSGFAGLSPLMPELPPHCAPYVFPLWVDTPDPGYATLRSLHMPVSRWDRLWPTVPAIDGDFGVQWSHHVLQLGCHQDISEEHLDAFVQLLLKLYARTYRAARPGAGPTPASAAARSMETLRS